MERNRLWTERQQGGGDIELRVNGLITSAHWCVLKNAPFFQNLKTQQIGDEIAPNSLTIEDPRLSVRSLVSAMKYIYTDHCFTEKSSASDFRQFCWLLETRTLTRDSFNVAVENVTEHNCIDYYKLGNALNIIPLACKAWREAILHNWTSQIQGMITPYTNLDIEISRECQTALHVSIEKGYIALAHALVSAGACTNVSDYQGKRPLALAVWYGYTELIAQLLDSHAHVDASDQWQQTALHKACGKGLNEIVRLLLRYGANVNLTSLDGYTPLHIAATGGHRDVVLTLLEHGAAWQIADDQWQRTALHMAAMKGDIDLVTLLLQLCDSKQVRQEVGIDNMTPLHTAVQAGYSQVVRILIDYGAPVNARDWEGRTPLHYAARSGNVEAMDLLIRSGAQPYTQDKHKMTCLHLAASRNHTNVVAMLVTQQSCPLNVIDKDGLTALHYAAENKNTNMVRQLLRAGTVPTILSNDGHIARNLVGKKRHLDTLKFLIMARS